MSEVVRRVNEAKHPSEDRPSPDVIQFEKVRDAVIDELEDYPESALVSVHCTGHAPEVDATGYRSISISISGAISGSR